MHLRDNLPQKETKNNNNNNGDKSMFEGMEKFHASSVGCKSVSRTENES